MKIKLQKILTLAFIVFIINACTKITDKELINPNFPSESTADVDLYLNAVEGSFEGFFQSTSYLAGGLVRQRPWSGPTYQNGYSPSTFDGIWVTAYTAINNINSMNQLAIAQKKYVQAGIGLVLKAYMYGTMVDCFDSIPFDESVLGATNTNPKKQSGQYIYNQIDTMLGTAISYFNRTDNNGTPTQDIFYAGSKTNWRAAAKTIRLKFLAQQRLVNAAVVAPKIQALLAENDLIKTTPLDFNFKYGTNQNSPDSRHGDYGTNYRATSPTATTGAGDYLPTYFMWAVIAEKRGQLSNGGWQTSDITVPSIQDTFDDPRRRYYFYRQRASYADVNSASVSCSITPKPAYFSQEPTVPFCLPAGTGGRGYWGRDHGDNSGTPPDANFRTTWGLYPAGGDFDANQGTSTFLGRGAKGAGISPIWNSEFTLFLTAELYLAAGDVTNARTNLEAGIRRSIEKVQGYGTTISFTYPTTDTNMLLNTTTKKNRYVKIVMSRFDEAANNNAKMDILQKEYYIALWGNGIEPYNNYRRTGYPSNMQRPVIGDVSNTNYFMRSFFYPSTYATRNINFSGQKSPGTKANKVFWDNNADNFIK